MFKYKNYLWTEDEEKTLWEIMISPERKKTKERLSTASEKLERTFTACQNRWSLLKNKLIEKG